MASFASGCERWGRTSGSPPRMARRSTGCRRRSGWRWWWATRGRGCGRWCGRCPGPASRFPSPAGPNRSTWPWRPGSCCSRSPVPLEVLGIIAAGVLGSMVGARPRLVRCGRAIPWFDNVPVISWLLLGGRCRHCRERISAQYPLIEAAVAGVWAGAAWWYGVTLHGLAAALFGTILLGIAVTDARHYLIPDEYTWGGLAVGLLLALRGGFGGLLTAGIGAGLGLA